MLYLPLPVSLEQSIFDVGSLRVAERQRVWRSINGDWLRHIYHVGDRTFVVSQHRGDGQLFLTNYERQYYVRHPRQPIYWQGADDMAALVQAGIEAAKAEIALLRMA